MRISPQRKDHKDFYIDLQTAGLQLYLRIETAANDVFSFYSPEAWQYFSLDRVTAEQLAKGFHEYYADGRSPVVPTAITEATQLHRNAAVCWLADRSFPLHNKECYWEPHIHATIRDPIHLLLYPPGMPRREASSPFAVLQQDLQKNNVTNVEEFTWQYYCGLLFHKLLCSSKPARDPTVLIPPKVAQPIENVSELRIENDSKLESESPLIPDDVTHQRGRTLVSQKELERTYSRSFTLPVQWGPLFYEEAIVSLSHFCVSGVTRSGKTTLLRLLFQSLHENVTPQPRFVLYDAKPDLLPYLFPPGSFQGPLSDDQVAEAVYLLSPFDSRGTAWDIAADAAKESMAAELAEVLFPSFEGSNDREFYGPAVRDVTTELMVALTRTAAQKWTLYDLVCAMQLDNIQSVLCSTPNGRRLYTLYFEGKKSNVPEDLPKALRTKSALLLRAAYAWSHAERRIGLRQWVRSQNKTIVLFNDDEHLEANAEINRILLNLLARTLLAVKNPPARTYVYLDEMEHLGFINPMTRLIEKGADLQVNLAVAFHDLLTLKKVYGDATEGILGQASFQAFLKVNNRDTLEWASYQIGTPEVKVTSTQSGTSHTSSGDGDDTHQSQQTSQSSSDNYASRRLVIPDEIRDLPLPAQAKKLSGYFVAPIHSPYLGTLPASKVIRSRTEYLVAEQSEENFYSLWPKVEGVSEHCPQPDERYELPDDMFRTLYDLGFRKPGYTPTSSTPPPSSDLLPASENPLSSIKPLPPADDALPEKPKADDGPTDVDDDVDIPDIDFGDE